MNPKAKSQLVKSVFDFLMSIDSIAGAESDDVIGEGIENWLKVKTPKPMPAKKRARRKKSNTTVRPWSNLPGSK